MTFLWFVTGASLVVALLAFRQARATARRLEQLTQMYWELKYQYGELRLQLQRANPAAAPEPTPVPASSPADGFVPLSSLKR